MSDRYLERRGFSPETIARCGWTVAQVGPEARQFGLPHEAANALAWRIPYSARQGREPFERIRLIDEAVIEALRGGKYRQPAGVPLDLYDPFGWLDTGQLGQPLLLIEGEANAAAVHQLSPATPVVGLPGHGALKPELAARVADAAESVMLWLDPDERGYEDALRGCCDRLWAAGVRELRRVPAEQLSRLYGTPDAPDANELLLLAPSREDAADSLRALLDPEVTQPLHPEQTGAGPDLAWDDEPAPPPSGTSAFDLLTFEDLQALPDLSWLIDGLMPAAGLSVLYGASGSFKSFLSLDWALCVATGLPWHGHAVEPRWVVYVAAEGRCGLKQRVEAWWRARGRPSLHRVRFLPEAVNLLDRSQVERARAALASLPEHPTLLVVDTMARTMVGGDENAAKDVGQFVAAVDGLRNGGSALVVHHAGKAGGGERGSSALRGAADLMAKVERDGQGPRLTVTCEKLKDAEEWRSIDLRMEPEAASCVLHLAVEAEEARDDLRERVLAFVREHHGPASKRAIRGGVEGRNASIDEALRELEHDEVVRKTNKGYEACPERWGTVGHANPAAPRGGVPWDGETPEGGPPGGTPRADAVPGDVPAAEDVDGEAA